MTRTNASLKYPSDYYNIKRSLGMTFNSLQGRNNSYPRRVRDLYQIIQVNWRTRCQGPASACRGVQRKLYLGERETCHLSWLLCPCSKPAMVPDEIFPCQWTALTWRGVLAVVKTNHWKSNPGTKVRGPMLCLRWLSDFSLPPLPASSFSSPPLSPPSSSSPLHLPLPLPLPLFLCLSPSPSLCVFCCFFFLF